MNNTYYNKIFWLKFSRYNCNNSLITKKDSIQFLVISAMHVLLFLFVGSPIQFVSGVYILLGLNELYIRKSSLSRAKIQRYTLTLLILLILILILIPISSFINDVLV